MRGKKAKQLRRTVNLMSDDGLADILYMTNKVSRQILFGNPPQRTVVTTLVKTLGDCKRRRYKILKKLYKNGDISYAS